MNAFGFERSRSAYLLVRLEARDIAMFRFLLEARENLALFTALERRPALLRLAFAPESRKEVLQALAEISETVSFACLEWPFEA